MKNKKNILSYHWLETWYIFCQFMYRDIYVHIQQIQDYLINYVILYPLIFAFCFGYLQAHIYFGTGNTYMGTLLLAGNILVVLLVVTYKQTISLLFDLENKRCIEYQISLLHPRLVILERILFTSLFTFVLTMPFFPIAKLALGSYLNTSNTSWPALFGILYLGSLCCSAYHQCAALVLKSSQQITSLWSRINNVLLALGGFWIPFHTIEKYSVILSYVVRLNPLIYISEGLRNALLGNKNFLPLKTCTLMLIIFSGIFIMATWYMFKKRTDHI